MPAWKIARSTKHAQGSPSGIEVHVFSSQQPGKPTTHWLDFGQGQSIGGRYKDRRRGCSERTSAHHPSDIKDALIFKNQIEYQPASASATCSGYREIGLGKPSVLAHLARP